MSNPGVIVLDSVSGKKGKLKRFTLEDNIGEAIHLHINDMRIDFTISEFFKFASMVKESLRKIDFLCGYNIDSFDECFLKGCAEFLPSLVEIRVEEIKLASLKCVVPCRRKPGLNRVLPVWNLPAYRYLKGDKSEFLEGLDDYFAAKGESKLLEGLALLKKNKYPVKDRYVILFDGQDYIRYGQEIAAILGYLYGFDFRIKVLRFYFKGKGHLLFPVKNNVKIVLKQFFKRRKKR